MKWYAILLSLNFVNAGSAEISFNREIRPILSENCFYCHGQDGNKRKAGIRLDVREDALKLAESKIAPIVPGNPADSGLIQRIFNKDPEEMMPPENSHRHLSMEQRKLLQRWIAEGAQYESHWAFVAPVKAPLPAAWKSPALHNEIDFFVAQKLEQEKLSPTPSAERPTLLRRLSLDLIGLSPTPEEVDTFVADQAPNAYEKQVDRLMNSPHYGERMALPWLDAARYADSNGFQQDGDTFQYVWRDWVVQSLNSDLPFDQFSIQQLAGDLMPNATQEQKIASAFNRNHLLNGEGGAIAEEQRFNILFDRVDTTSTVWMGLTMACAQCHDHKYDPMTQKDYYSMMALFNHVPESGVPGGSGQYRVADPSIQVTTAEETEQLALLEKAAQAARLAEQAAEQSDASKSAYAAWEQSMAGDGAVTWEPMTPTGVEAKDGVDLRIQKEGVLYAKGVAPDKTDYVIKLPGQIKPLTGLRIETIPDVSLPSGGAGRSDSGNAVLTRITLRKGDEEIALNAASADYTQGSFSPNGVLDKDDNTGWAFHPDVKTPHHLVIQTASPVPNPEATPLTLTIEFRSTHKAHQLGKFRISSTTSGQPAGRQGVPAEIAAILKQDPAKRAKEATDKLRAHFFKTSPPAAVVSLKKDRESRETALNNYKTKLPRVMVMSDAKPRQTKMLDRGNYLAPTNDVVGGTPGFLPPGGKPGTLNRLDFANWLFQSDNPLTARVQVNRMWQHFFGVGLVKTAEDFGVQSEMPLYGELLDWLSVEFREHGWSMKHLNRLIVMSATYQQGSRQAGVSKQRDPENRFLTRGPRFRAPAMVLRDAALAASGLLDDRIGGKPVYPYQPEAIWETLAITKERDFTYPASTGADLYRRSLYTFWRRTIGPANMFDGSNRQTCKVRTGITSTPLHSLTTMNDLTWAEAARVLAAKSLEAGGDAATQLRFAFRRVLGRTPTEADLTALQRAWDKQRTIYQADPKAAAEVVALGQAPKSPALNVVEHASLTNICLALLNLDEALTKE
jgi:hypothetical protein